MLVEQYLDKCKIALKVQSDHALAKALVINSGRIAEYRKGNSVPDAYACLKIALTLNLDPLTVLSDIERQFEKNEQRKSFWEDFFQSVGRRAGRPMLALLFGIGLLTGSATGAVDPQNFAKLCVVFVTVAFMLQTSHNVYYVKRQ